MYLSKAKILPIYRLALTIAQKVFHLLIVVQFRHTFFGNSPCPLVPLSPCHLVTLYLPEQHNSNDNERIARVNVEMKIESCNGFRNRSLSCEIFNGAV
jgi:hypothetical protein